MGLVLSHYVRRRWLSLTGLVIALLAIPVGAATNNGVAIAVLIGVGGALMLAQVVVSVIRNLKAAWTGQPPQY